MTQKNYFKKSAFVVATAILLFSACKKDKIEEVEKVKTQEIIGTKGIYVLTEGSMGQNNSAITYYDYAKGIAEKDYYKKVNGTNLGETATDLQVYGSKMYCVVSGIQGSAQSFIDIIDVESCKSLKRIPLTTGNVGALPRYVTFFKNKAYVSRYDGKISRIDTATLTVDAELQLMNGVQKAEGLEGVAVANGKLYVNNSAHLSYPNGLKNKVTVIDLSTFTKLKDIAVTFNPINIAAAENGDLLVVSWGDYNMIDPAMQKINSTNDAVTATYNLNVGALTTYKNQAYLVTDWSSNVLPFDVVAGTTGPSFIKDGTTVLTPNGVTVNQFDQSVVIADANGYHPTQGGAFVFGTNGIKKLNFETAGMPQRVVFNYNYKYELKVK